MTVVELGDKVEDRVTGFTGIAIGVTDDFAGCTRVVVETGDEGRVTREHFDIDAIEVLKRGVVDQPDSDDAMVPVGAHVFDLESGFEGTVGRTTQWLFRANNALVRPNVSDQSIDRPDSEVIDIPQLDVVEKGKYNRQGERDKVLDEIEAEASTGSVGDKGLKRTSADKF